MALELHYAPGKEDTYIIPPSVDIIYKGKTYSLRIHNDDRATYRESFLSLYRGDDLLGSCAINTGTPLMIESLTSYNMVRETGLTYKYFDNSHAMRTPDRIPVGTILIETLKQIAALNGDPTIELVSMNDARRFYIKKGFTPIGPNSATFQYQGSASSSAAAASSAAATTATTATTASKPRRRRNRKTRRRRN